MSVWSFKTSPKLTWARFDIKLGKLPARIFSARGLLRGAFSVLRHKVTSDLADACQPLYFSPSRTAHLQTPWLTLLPPFLPAPLSQRAPRPRLPCPPAYCSRRRMKWSSGRGGQTARSASAPCKSPSTATGHRLPLTSLSSFCMRSGTCVPRHSVKRMGVHGVHAYRRCDNHRLTTLVAS